jgi:hypothetical protein
MGIFGDLLIGPYELRPQPSGATTGNATNYVVYAWWGSFLFYQRCKSVFELLPLRLIDKTERTGNVAPAITWSHICLLPMGPSEEDIVYSKGVSTQDGHWRLIQAVETTIRNMPGIFYCTRNSSCHRPQLCIQTNGEHIQQCFINFCRHFNASMLIYNN